jgi:hypothetical protein
MRDLQAKLEKLLTEVSECELIANLATDPDKRAAFERLTRQYRAMADELQADIEKMGSRAE